MEALVAVPALNFFRMFQVGGKSLQVARQAGWIFNADLLAEVSHGAGRRLRWYRQKGSQKAHRAELQGKSEAIVIPSSNPDDGVIDFIQMEKACQLFRGRLSAVPTVGISLLRR